MNKKGFTLVELLATIVILILLTFIASFAVNKIVNDSKISSHNSTVDSIISSAIAYVNDNDNINATNIDGYKIYLSTLASNGYIEENIKDPKNSKKINLDSSYITISKVTSAQTTADGEEKNYKYSGNYKYQIFIYYR